MKKAGEITYSTVNRENSGEGQVNAESNRAYYMQTILCTDCILYFIFVLYFYVAGTIQSLKTLPPTD